MNSMGLAVDCERVTSNPEVIPADPIRIIASELPTIRKF
jgi:hypothetical protein